MDRDEFLRHFREALVGKVPENVINEHAAYYRNYINNQAGSGMSEEDVIRGLGDPRLLAKTIEESSKFTRENGAESVYSGTNSETYSDAYSNIYGGTYSGNADYSQDEGYGRSDYSSGSPYMRRKVTTVPLWLGVLAVFAIAALIIVAVFNIFVIFLPFILVGVLVSAAYRIVQSVFR